MVVDIKQDHLRKSKATIKALALKGTQHVMKTKDTEDETLTLKLAMDELFCASFNVVFTQLTIMSSLTF